LAGEAVTEEDVAAGKTALGPGSADEVDEANDGGDGVEGSRGVQVTAAVLENLRLAPVDQYESPPNGADVQRLVVLVEYQYRGGSNSHLAVTEGNGSR
jgi:hypothetical protein